MKIRNGFVTNSSSSSFILAFKDESDFKEFKRKCEEYNYEEIFKFIKRNKVDFNNMSISKEELIEKLKMWLTIDEENDFLYEKTKNIVDFRKQKLVQEEIRKTAEFQELIATTLEKKKFEEKAQKIRDAKYVADTMIWDSEGGLLEFAIRQGILRQFPINQWLMGQIDIG